MAAPRPAFLTARRDAPALRRSPRRRPRRAPRAGARWPGWPPARRRRRRRWAPARCASRVRSATRRPSGARRRRRTASRTWLGRARNSWRSCDELGLEPEVRARRPLPAPPGSRPRPSARASSGAEHPGRRLRPFAPRVAADLMGPLHEEQVAALEPRGRARGAAEAQAGGAAVGRGLGRWRRRGRVQRVQVPRRGARQLHHGCSRRRARSAGWRCGRWRGRMSLSGPGGRGAAAEHQHPGIALAWPPGHAPEGGGGLAEVADQACRRSGAASRGHAAHLAEGDLGPDPGPRQLVRHALDGAAPPGRAGRQPRERRAARAPSSIIRVVAATTPPISCDRPAGRVVTWARSADGARPPPPGSARRAPPGRPGMRWSRSASRVVPAVSRRRIREGPVRMTGCGSPGSGPELGRLRGCRRRARRRRARSAPGRRGWRPSPP